ncbi:MEDS domain-containing protein [Micromonospora halophytica]|uniref:MEDS domain-containing protein n=1 Tax=Micromonospora halophytica TaxID=47864 RepID=UPI001B8CE17C|nr:MEDS domain-containing protein [Micromonospora halophytica]
MTASAVVDQVRLGDHVCCVHDDESDGLRAAGRFVAGGLRLGHRALWFTDALPPAAARAHLDGQGVATEAALAGGQLRILPAAEAYVAGGRFVPEVMLDALAAEIDRARREGHPGLRMVGDMGWALRHGASVTDLRRYEAEANRLFIDGHAAGMCLYDRRFFPAEYLLPTATAHPATVGPRAGHAWTPLLRAHRTRDPHGLRLVGEIDRSNRDAFAAMLDDVTGRATNERATVLDVSELSFADVGAASALARTRRNAPSTVRLVGCHPTLTRLLDLVDVTDPAGGVA